MGPDGVGEPGFAAPVIEPPFSEPIAAGACCPSDDLMSRVAGGRALVFGSPPFFEDLNKKAMTAPYCCADVQSDVRLSSRSSHTSYSKVVSRYRVARARVEQ